MENLNSKSCSPWNFASVSTFINHHFWKFCCKRSIYKNKKNLWKFSLQKQQDSQQEYIIIRNNCAAIPTVIHSTTHCNTQYYPLYYRVLPTVLNSNVYFTKQYCQLYYRVLPTVLHSTARSPVFRQQFWFPPLMLPLAVCQLSFF